MELTPTIIREIYSYDPTEPLALRWRTSGRGRGAAGAIAGYWHTVAKSSRLGRFVDVNTVRVPAHRAVWVHVKGEAPPKLLGFIDGDFGNIRIENLAPIVRQSKTALMAAFKDRIDGGIGWSTYLRRRNIKRDYGITLERYNELLEEQKGLCAICGRPETLVRRGKVEVLSVDHCHSSRTVRGLLCGNCNNGIGRFKDDPIRLRAAADYLERHLSATS